MATGASLGQRRREAGADLRGQSLQLQDRRRPVHVGADHQHFFVLLLDQPAREFAGGRGLAGALQAGEHDDDGPLRPQIEAGTRLAHEPRQFLVHDFDEGLPGRQALGDLDADRARLDRVGEALDHGQRHVGVEQREANFAHRVGDIVVGRVGRGRKGTSARGQTGSESVKHSADIIQCPRRERVG